MFKYPKSRSVQEEAGFQRGPRKLALWPERPERGGEHVFTCFLLVQVYWAPAVHRSLGTPMLEMKSPDLGPCPHEAHVLLGETGKPATWTHTQFQIFPFSAMIRSWGPMYPTKWKCMYWERQKQHRRVSVSSPVLQLPVPQPAVWRWVTIVQLKGY